MLLGTVQSPGQPRPGDRPRPSAASAEAEEPRSVPMACVSPPDVVSRARALTAARLRARGAAPGSLRAEPGGAV